MPKSAYFLLTVQFTVLVTGFSVHQLWSTGFDDTRLNRRSGSCSALCYEHGTCNEEIGGRCDCPKNRAGPTCEEGASESSVARQAELYNQPGHDPLPCLNNCTRRGKCVSGVCVCNRGHFAADCSLSLDAASGKLVLLAGTSYQPRSRRPHVYVYDIPHNYSSWHNPVQLDRSLHWFFWERLLGAGALVADGEAADWYYIPIKLRTTSDCYRLLHAIEYVRQHWPWYDRLHGQRHFVIHTGDLGRGEATYSVREALPNLTWVHHWGLMSDFRTSNWRKGHRPGKDIVVPIFFRPTRAQRVVPVSGLHPRAPRLPRTGTLLFSGRICGDYSDPDPAKPWPHCATEGNHGYSQGVRQMVHFHHHNRTGFKVVTRNSQYLLDLMRFKWCLAPSGGGHGHRQALVALMGCLPLVISDTVMQPFEPEMDWSQFGMRLPHSEIPRIHEALDVVGEERLEAMRDALRCAAQHLAFSSVGGAVFQEDGRWDAFEFILEILRMQQTYPDLAPELYTQTDERFRHFVNCGEADMAMYGRKFREAQMARYPKATTLEDGSEVTWQVMYDKNGLNRLIDMIRRQPDPHMPAGKLPLCSLSKWDEEAARCVSVTHPHDIYWPGGVQCERHAADLSKCPRLWP